MPYLRVTCLELPDDRYRAIAQRLTQERVDLFYNPRSPTSREEQQYTTVHFIPYRNGESFIGGQTPQELTTGDVTVEAVRLEHVDKATAKSGLRADRTV